MSSKNDRLTLYWYLALFTVSICLFSLQITEVPAHMWRQLIGDKQTSPFDLFSIHHFIAGILLGGTWRRLLKNESCCPTACQKWFLCSLTCIYLWEATELIRELEWFGPYATFYTHGVEHWSNRFLADPLLGIVGCLLHKHAPRLYIVAAVTACLWISSVTFRLV